MKYFVKSLSSGATLTAYLHDKSPELSNADVRPAVLICPGGGYRICSEREAEPVALAFLGEGYHSFVLRYTTGDAAPADEAFEDAKEALRYMKENAGELRLDAKKIAAVGFSAGGHLASMLGTVSEDKPAALVLGYPVTLAEFDPASRNLITTADYVSASTPRTYLFTTAADELVPVQNTLRFASALDTAGVKFELHIFPEGPHGLSLARPETSDGHTNLVNPKAAAWFQEACSFLRGIFGELETNNEALGLGMDAHSIGLDTPVSVLMEREDVAAVMESVIPGIGAMLVQNPSAGNYSLNVMHRFSPEVITDELILCAEKALAPFA